MSTRRWIAVAVLGLAGALLVALGVGAFAKQPMALAAALAGNPGLQPIGNYSVSKDGRTLRFIVAPAADDVRPGWVSYSANTTEGASNVIVSVRATTATGPAAGTAIGLGATRVLEVTLNAPLGGRAVIDAATGQPVATAPVQQS